MEMTEIAAGRAEIAASAAPQVRLFHIDRVNSETPRDLFREPVEWQVAGPGTVDHFSAACFFMGRNLQRASGVPQGLIHASWGGSIIQAWISEQAFRDLGSPRPRHRPARAALAPILTPRRRASISFPSIGGPPTIPACAPAGTRRILTTAAWASTTQIGMWEDYSDPAMRGFDGVAWFRAEFTLTEAQARGDAQLSLGPVQNFDHTFINGVRIGGYRDPSAPRQYDVPAKRMRAGRNSIAIGILDTGGAGGLDGRGGSEIFASGGWVAR